jgi:uncharacterized repeat protein (TIGR01451 family)
MALNNGVGFAGDPVLGNAPAEAQRGIQLRGRQSGLPAGMPSRYSRSGAPAADPSSKNYYDALFAEQGKEAVKEAAKEPVKTEALASDDWMQDSATVAPAAPAVTAKSAAAVKPAAKVAEAPAEAKVQPQPVKANAAASAAGAGHAVKPAADSRRFSASVQSTKAAPETPESKVIQAGYDKSPQSSERKMIQQVRSETSGKRPTAPPMPQLDGSAHQAPAAKTSASAGVAAKADTGPQSPQMTLEWVKKGDINVGQECQVELHVKNSGTTATSQVAIEGQFPSTVRLTSAEPKPAVSGDKVTWSFDSMAPGAEHKIVVKLIPSRRGDIGATAQVRFTGSASASFRVEEPLLKVALKGASEVTLGDPAPQLILVSNPGTGTVQNVKVEARLSDGLEHRAPGERLIMEVGSISPGETQTVRLPISAIKGGPQSINVTATSSSDATATATSQINVIAPSLKVAIDGPALRYKGRNAKYTLTISNDGSVANNNVRISQTVADGFKFVSADHNGKFDASSKHVQWFVGRLEPGQSVQVSCELNAVALGDFTHAVSVLSDSGVRADAKSQTKVDGIASLTMELVDLDDPVEIGAETAYEIRVKNEGSKAATGVSIACELPPEMELKTVKAPVDAIVEGRQILFKSLEQVAPGAVATYRVHVKGVQEGNHRMRVRMTSASLQEPVVREEATKVYADSK